MNATRNLPEVLAGTRGLVAPVVFIPLSAKLAAAAGFEALHRAIGMDELLAIERATVEK